MAKYEIENLRIDGDNVIFEIDDPMGELKKGDQEKTALHDAIIVVEVRMDDLAQPTGVPAKFQYQLKITNHCNLANGCKAVVIISQDASGQPQRHSSNAILVNDLDVKINPVRRIEFF